jgi:hypothetical protein
MVKESDGKGNSKCEILKMSVVNLNSNWKSRQRRR